MKTLVCALLILGLSFPVVSQEISTYVGAFGPKYYADSQKLTKRQIHQIILDSEDELAISYWRKHSDFKALAIGTLVVGFALYYVGLDVYFEKDYWTNEDKLDSAPYFIGSTIFSSLSIACSLNSATALRKSILTYNSRSMEVKLDLEQKGAGLGLRVKF